MNLLIVSSVKERQLLTFKERVHHAGWATETISLVDFLTSPPALDRFDDIAIAGGDGTVNAVASRVSERPLLCVPVGTGNDFARALAITSPGDAARALRCGRREKVDLLYANGEAVVNGVGVGLDGLVAKAHAAGRSYAVGAILSAWKMPRFRARIEIDGVAETVNFLSLAIANGPWSGGGFKTAPAAVIDDGLLDIVLIRPISRGVFLRSMIAARKGEHVKRDDVSARRGRQVIIESEEFLLWHIDGEVRRSARIEIVVAPKARLFYRL